MRQRFCDDDQEPVRGKLIGTIYRCTFPRGGRARRTLPMYIDQAITFFDPFQEAR